MFKTALACVGLVTALGGTALADDVTPLVDKADVLRQGLTGVSITAVHEVVDTGGATQRQVYSVLNHIPTGNSFIVMSSDSAAINGTVFLIKGGTLYAAAPNQRSFVRLGGLNLDRRISGSLFSHWDLQGNMLLTQEYTAALVKNEGGVATVALAGKDGSHYAKIEAAIDAKSGLFTSMDLFDAQGLLKQVAYKRPKLLGSGTKRKIPTLVEMTRASGRSDLPVAKTTFRLSEAEFDPQVDYGAVMAVTDGNLQKLRSQYVLSPEAFRSLVAEVSN